MPKLKEGQLPKYRLHKQSGQAIVTFSGRDFLLGKHGSAASRQEYRRLTAEWLASNQITASPTAGTPHLTVAELVLAFWRHATTYYRQPTGEPTGELDNFRRALKPLRQLYGRTTAASFGPLALKAVREHMISLGWCRSSVNRQTARLKHVFKWAVENELVPGSVYQGLAAVAGLRTGRTRAKDTPPVQPVSVEAVERVLPYVSRQVQAMIKLQLVTGMRPAEVCSMRGCDIDTTSQMWVYRPASHKTAHHGHERTVYLGPLARSVIEPFMRYDAQAFLFSPADAEAERLARRHEQRETPASCGNVPGSNRRHRRARPPQGFYTVTSYRRAIARACQAAFSMPISLREPVTKEALARDTAEKKRMRRAARAAWNAANVWHPHQLRHNVATRLRKDYGLEAAQVILGHKTLRVTELYAQKNVDAAKRIAAAAG
jgi:integrase